MAILEPVDFNGVTVGRATLHNVPNVMALGLREGDYVVVERANDVIPQAGFVGGGGD
jgi:DNA ligase (NAD+)